MLRANNSCTVVRPARQDWAAPAGAGAVLLDAIAAGLRLGPDTTAVAPRGRCGRRSPWMERVWHEAAQIVA
jgi:hypothetical protein